MGKYVLSGKHENFYSSWQLATLPLEERKRFFDEFECWAHQRLREVFGWWDYYNIPA